MLEGLDKIPWNTLTHAYGEATDVPDLLRNLTSDDEATWNDAFATLHTNIWHQGTVYEATAYAVPFLVELLNVANIDAVPAILQFLSLLYDGNSYLDVHQHLSVYSEEERQSKTFQQQLTQELKDVIAVQEAVAKPVDIYLKLMQNEDEVIRSAVIMLMCSLVSKREYILPAIQERLVRDSSFTVRAVIAYSLPTLLEHDDDVLAILTPYTLKEREPLERYYAALGIANGLKEKTPETVVYILVSTLEPDKKLQEQYKAISWLYGWEIPVATGIAFSHIGIEKTEFALPTLINTIQELNSSAHNILVEVLLDLLFNKQQSKITEASDLSKLQLRLLTAIHDHALVIGTKLLGGGREIRMRNANIGTMLREYGIPSEPNELRLLLEN